MFGRKVVSNLQESVEKERAEMNSSFIFHEEISQESVEKESVDVNSTKEIVDESNLEDLSKKRVLT